MLTATVILKYYKVCYNYKVSQFLLYTTLIKRCVLSQMSWQNYYSRFENKWGGELFIRERQEVQHMHPSLLSLCSLFLSHPSTLTRVRVVQNFTSHLWSCNKYLDLDLESIKSELVKIRNSSVFLFLLSLYYVTCNNVIPK